MSDYSCSVCWLIDRPITMIAGTTICKPCLDKAVEKYKNNDENLKQNIENIISKDDDIYA